jgi:hypothetical protein
LIFPPLVVDSPIPLERMIFPDGPLFALLVDKENEPDVPDDVVPVLNTSAPEEPSVPELVEETTIAPEDLCAPDPDVSDIDPPEVVDEPPASINIVPCPSTVPVPIDTIMEPLLPA